MSGDEQMFDHIVGLLHDQTVEEKIIKNLVTHGDLYYAHSDRLSKDLFHKREYQLIFTAIKQIAGDGKEIDTITISDKLRSTGILGMPGNEKVFSTLMEHMDSAFTSPFMFEAHLEIAHKIRKRRMLFELGGDVREKCHKMDNPDDLIDYINTLMVELVSGIEKEFNAKEGVSEAVAEIFDVEDRGFIKTGIKDLDDFIHGFQLTDLVILGGVSSMGKTAFALRLFLNFMMAGEHPVFFSLEMSKNQLIHRLIAMFAEIHLSSIRKKSFSVNTREKIQKTADTLASMNFVVDDKTVYLEQIVSKIRKHHIKHKSRVFVIDYLQLVSVNLGKNSQREQEIAKITRTFKEIARSLDVVIIALSQMNREAGKRTNKRPVLSDLRESGAIEQDADFVIFPFRPAYYKVHEEKIPFRENAELIIAKGRGTGIATIDVDFISCFTKWINDKNTKTAEDDDVPF